MALTQVVEHHLPTYVSLALAWQKGGSENLHEIQNKMKVHRIEKTTNTRHQIYMQDSKIKQRREANCGGLESLLQPILCLFLAIARLSSHTTLLLQTTIKGWWWLSKRTTTLWDYSGRRNRFLRITYICPDEQKVSTIEAEGT